MKEFSYSSQACKHKMPKRRQHSDYRVAFIIFYPISHPTKELSGFPLQNLRWEEQIWPAWWWAHSKNFSPGHSSDPYRLLTCCYCPYLSWTSVNTNGRVFWAASIAVNTRVYGLANLPISLKSIFAGTLILSWSKNLTYSEGGAWRSSTRIQSCN